jgi:hypothetical protein
MFRRKSNAASPRNAIEEEIRENWALERARKLLICEISEVMGETESAAGNRSTELSKREKPRATANPMSRTPSCELMNKDICYEDAARVSGVS